MKNKYRIALLGGGQLGSRHLQALKRMTTPLEIWVVDPSDAALQTCRDRYDQVTTNNDLHKVEYSRSLNSIPTEFDLAIVATTALQRAQATRDLLKQSKVEKILFEKLLFASPQDYRDIGDLLRSRGIKSWVNFPMRQRSVCRRIFDEIHGQTVLYSAVASGQGLITNAVHYVDHMVELTGQKEFHVDTSGLKRTVLKSKRAGYLELTGTLQVAFANGSQGSFTFFDHGSQPIIIEIITGERRYIMREREHVMLVSRSSDRWAWREEPSHFPPQSEMTATVAEDILVRNFSWLTSFDESVSTHLQFLEPLRKFLNRLGEETYESYPFT